MADHKHKGEIDRLEAKIKRRYSRTASVICYTVDPKFGKVYVWLGRESGENKYLYFKTWSDFGGVVEDGERSETAAARELLEESLDTISFGSIKLTEAQRCFLAGITPATSASSRVQELEHYLAHHLYDFAIEVVGTYVNFQKGFAHRARRLEDLDIEKRDKLLLAQNPFKDPGQKAHQLRHHITYGMQIEWDPAIRDRFIVQRRSLGKLFHSSQRLSRLLKETVDPLPFPGQLRSVGKVLQVGSWTAPVRMMTSESTNQTMMITGHTVEAPDRTTLMKKLETETDWKCAAWAMVRRSTDLSGTTLWLAIRPSSSLQLQEWEHTVNKYSEALRRIPGSLSDNVAVYRRKRDGLWSVHSYFLEKSEVRLWSIQQLKMALRQGGQYGHEYFLPCGLPVLETVVAVFSNTYSFLTSSFLKNLNYNLVHNYWYDNLQRQIKEITEYSHLHHRLDNRSATGQALFRLILCYRPAGPGDGKPCSFFARREAQSVEEWRRRTADSADVNIVSSSDKLVSSDAQSPSSTIDESTRECSESLPDAMVSEIQSTSSESSRPE